MHIATVVFGAVSRSTMPTVLAVAFAACGGNMRPTTCLEGALLGGPAEKVRECYGAPDWRSICDPAQAMTCLKPSEERWHYEDSYDERDIPFLCLVVHNGTVSQFLHDSWGCALTESGEISSTRAPVP